MNTARRPRYASLPYRPETFPAAAAYADAAAATATAADAAADAAAAARAARRAAARQGYHAEGLAAYARFLADSPRRVRALEAWAAADDRRAHGFERLADLHAARARRIALSTTPG